jgi:hypothetical protein
MPTYADVCIWRRRRFIYSLVSFFPWTQAISIVEDSGEIDKYFCEDQGHDYRIGAAGLRILQVDCDDAGGLGDKGL